MEVHGREPTRFSILLLCVLTYKQLEAVASPGYTGGHRLAY